MTDPENDLNLILRRQITDEIAAALGISKDSWARKVVGPFFWPPAQLFSSLVMKIDRIIAERGAPEAAGQLLNRFVDQIQVDGKDLIPKDGPLIIASNHPGAYDSIALMSSLPRQDFKFIVSDVPLLRSLPAASQHCIFTPAGPHARMGALREIIHHVLNGGAVLIFPTGLVDPDPAFMPGPDQALGLWSESLDIVLRRAPRTRLQVAVVSGVLAPSCLRNPLTRIPDEPWRKQKLAEFIQVIQQLVFGRKFDLKTRLSFGRPMTGEELGSQGQRQDLHQAIIAEARAVLSRHLEISSS